MMNMPPAFDVTIYRSLHKDLALFSDQELVEHYKKHGKSEGRTSNGLPDRKAFASLITPDRQALEIGPFASPLLQGENISYCDVLDQDGLRERARSLGINPDFVPYIHYKLGPAFLDGIDRKFDAVLSSHCIEHQPDLINHLSQVERKLEVDGRYFALIPDKRYCFDMAIAPSTIAEVIQAHEEKRSVHTLRSIIEHRALTVHNDSAAHWSRRSVQPPSVSPQKVEAAIDEWRQAKGNYIDVHAWYFTPDTFVEIVSLLNQIGFTGLKVERVYPTRRDANEFWAILKKGECSAHPNDLDISINAQTAPPVQHNRILSSVRRKIARPVRYAKQLFKV